jgi:hypothetical protein
LSTVLGFAFFLAGDLISGLFLTFGFGLWPFTSFVAVVADFYKKKH